MIAEEAALNRAILLSLQDASYSSPASTPYASPTHSRGTPTAANWAGADVGSAFFATPIAVTSAAASPSAAVSAAAAAAAAATLATTAAVAAEAAAYELGQTSTDLAAATAAVAATAAAIPVFTTLNAVTVTSTSADADADADADIAISEDELRGSASNYVPTEEAVDVLVSLGFSRGQAIQALRECRGHLELAANRLINAEY